MNRFAIKCNHICCPRLTIEEYDEFISVRIQTIYQLKMVNTTPLGYCYYCVS